MNILVVLRQVPDAASELVVAESGRDLDREWLDLRLNDFDDHALEEAVLLKEATGARVVAATAGCCALHWRAAPTRRRRSPAAMPSR